MKKLFNEVLIRTPHFDIHQDWDVPIPGFYIVETIRKIRSIDELTEQESKEFIDLLKLLRAGMRSVLGITDVYLFQNEDSAHGFHLWVFPRHVWMEKFGKKIQSVRPIIEHAKQMHNDQGLIEKVKSAASLMREFFSKEYEHARKSTKKV